MPIRIKINDKEFQRQLTKATADGLQRAAAFLDNKCREAVNKPNMHFRLAGPAGHTHRLYQNLHNRFAGQPPFKRTGKGRGRRSCMNTTTTPPHRPSASASTKPFPIWRILSWAP